jgi:hypothetical protein
MVRADKLYKKVSAQLRADIVGRYAYYFNQDPNQGAIGEAITYFVSELKTNSKGELLVNSKFCSQRDNIQKII